MTRGMRRGLARALPTIACALALSLSFAGLAADGDWEMRVCADPDGMPFSNRDLEGYENRIAAVLAEELGATLTYDWFTQGPDMVNFHLREGQCDLIIGVPDGYEDLLTTVAYYRSPYVFLYPTDSEHKVTSLDDPALAEMRIGVQAVGIPPHQGLINRGLGHTVVRRFAGPGLTNAAASFEQVVDALANEEIDVGIAWGPVAGYVAERSDVDLEITPVTPEFEPPFLTMVFAMAIGMRPGDESFRDRLDVALVNRWQEIQAILGDYGVPTAPLPTPTLPADEPSGTVVRVGVVIPGTTGHSRIRASINDLVGDAARMGALMAESDIANLEAVENTLKVLPASSPSAEAAFRAAERLVATEEVTAIVGGLGDGQAERLSEALAAGEVLFFNIGSPSMALRELCNPATFHIEPSAAMYLDALAEWYSERGMESWFVVHEDNPAGEALRERAVRAIESHGGGELAGTAATTIEQPVYSAEISELEVSGADVVLLLLGPADQIAFVSQQQSFASGAIVAMYPHPITQTRDFIAATSDAARDGGADQRMMSWETTLEEGAMGVLNERYTSRWGQPMDTPAWSSYQAIRIVDQAVRDSDSDDSAALVAYLESPDTSFEAKGLELSFRPWDHQLGQPLYVVDVNPDAQWGTNLSQMVAFAELAGTVPSELGDGARERLLALGDDEEALACRR
ncbi:MAG: quinoprotein dehydrogenase-associated putative ABC transporter substrate-binding protein [Trueperaceae bacterium]